MEELPLLQAPEKEIPRWVQILAGLALGLFTLLCAFGALSLLLWPNRERPVLCFLIGMVLLLGCFWVCEKCFRLLTGRKNQGGLMAPKTLRMLSLFFLVLPVAGLFTGYYRTMGLVAISQALAYFSAFLGLRALARNRQAKQTESQQSMPTNHDRRA